MAPVRKTSDARTINHFTHPAHPLTYLEAKTEFLCDGCKQLGESTRYRCSTCDFDLHEYCATCPDTLPSFLHPKHDLVLVMRKPQGARSTERVCDVCASHVNGLFYRCKFCEFDVHPLCTRLPENFRSSLHPNHVLKLMPSPSGICLVCKKDCSSWVYRCVVCSVNIHFHCFFAPTTAAAPANTAKQLTYPTAQPNSPAPSTASTSSSVSRYDAAYGARSVPSRNTRDQNVTSASYSAVVPTGYSNAYVNVDQVRTDTGSVTYSEVRTDAGTYSEYEVSVGEGDDEVVYKLAYVLANQHLSR